MQTHTDAPTIQYRYSTGTVPVLNTGTGTDTGTGYKTKETGKRASAVSVDPLPGAAVAGGTANASPATAPEGCKGWTREQVLKMATKAHINISPDGITEFMEQMTARSWKTGTGEPIRNMGGYLRTWAAAHEQFQTREAPEPVTRETEAPPTVETVPEPELIAGIVSKFSAWDGGKQYSPDDIGIVIDKLNRHTLPESAFRARKFTGQEIEYLRSHGVAIPQWDIDD